MKLDHHEIITSKDLKSAYLKRAKILHPDSGESGSEEKFKLLQEAYEELLKIPEHKRTNQQEKYEEFFKQKYSGEQNPYEEDEFKRKQYEKWRKETFSSYSQEKHEEFLRQRYQKNNFNQHRDHFNASDHFYDQEFASESEEEDITKRPTFKTNSLFLAFLFHPKYRSYILWNYREELFVFMIIFAISMNLLIYYKAMTRREPNPYLHTSPNRNNK